MTAPARLAAPPARARGDLRAGGRRRPQRRRPADPSPVSPAERTVSEGPGSLTGVTREPARPMVTLCDIVSELEGSSFQTLTLFYGPVGLQAGRSQSTFKLIQGLN